MARFKAKEITTEPGQRGQSSFDNEARTPLIILLAVTGTVLLIACANIANLLLVRGAGRAAEMAVRLSIGASRRQLITQLLTESILLAAFGAIAGLFVAKWTFDLIASIMPPDDGQHDRVLAEPDDDHVRGRDRASSRASRSACSPRCTARAPISPAR